MTPPFTVPANKPLLANSGSVRIFGRGGLAVISGIRVLSIVSWVSKMSNGVNLVAHRDGIVCNVLVSH